MLQSPMQIIFASHALPTAKQTISSKDNIPHCSSSFLIQRSTFNKQSFAIRHRPLCSDGIGCIIPAFNAIYSIEAAHFILLRVCSCRTGRFRQLTDMPFYITPLSAAITIWNRHGDGESIRHGLYIRFSSRILTSSTSIIYLYQ